LLRGGEFLVISLNTCRALTSRPVLAFKCSFLDKNKKGNTLFFWPGRKIHLPAPWNVYPNNKSKKGALLGVAFFFYLFQIRAFFRQPFDLIFLRGGVEVVLSGRGKKNPCRRNFF